MRNLVYDKPIVYVEMLYSKSKRYALINKNLFILFNMLTIFFTFGLAVVTTLVVSNTIPVKDYFYLATIASSIVTFFTSVFNFLVIKENAKRYKDLYHFIQVEIMHYETSQGPYKGSVDKDFEIFNRVSVYADNHRAKEWNEKKS